MNNLLSKEVREIHKENSAFQQRNEIKLLDLHLEFHLPCVDRQIDEMHEFVI